MMRTVYTGEFDATLQAGQEVISEAFDAAVEVIKPGVPAGEVDAVTRSIIAQSDFGAEQSSRTGYSVGIGLPPDWGEGQILSMQPGETRPLGANMTFHLVPWIQMPGKGGIGITETIRVTNNGCERLTNFDRKLFIK